MKGLDFKQDFAADARALSDKARVDSSGHGHRSDIGKDMGNGLAGAGLIPRSTIG
jgi:hypothetical protein